MASEYRMIEKSSQESVMSELDVFETPISKTSIREGELYELPPERHPVGLSPITFEVTGNNMYYIDLNKTLVHLQGTIKHQDGTKLDDDGTKVQITHSTNLFHSMISNLRIYFNQHEVENNVNYAHKAFLTTILNFGSDAKHSHLSTVKWIDDGMHEEHCANLSAQQKALMKARASKLAGSKIIDMIGRPITPLFTQGKYLIPGLNIRIEIEFHQPKDLLQYTETGLDANYKFEITKAALLLRRVQVHPTIATSHARLLDNGKRALYQINRTDVQFFTISPGRQSQNINVINNKQEPKICIVGLMSHSAKEGSYEHSSFKFEHYNVSSINVVVNGNYTLKKPLQLNYDENIYIRAYHNLMTVCDKTHSDAGNDITPEQFKNSLCLYAFDLTPDLCHGDGVHLMRTSDTTIELTFDQALPETVSAMVYCEYDDLLRIDKTRTVEIASKS